MVSGRCYMVSGRYHVVSRNPFPHYTPPEIYRNLAIIQNKRTRRGAWRPCTSCPRDVEGLGLGAGESEAMEEVHNDGPDGLEHKRGVVLAPLYMMIGLMALNTHSRRGTNDGKDPLGLDEHGDHEAFDDYEGTVEMKIPERSMNTMRIPEESLKAMRILERS